mgnify:CR=1 FL=1
MKNEELFQIKGSILTIRVPAELDHHLADEIRSGAEAIQSTHNIRQIDFDFGQTTFMDSSGIGLVMGRFRELQLLGGKDFRRIPGDRSGAGEIMESVREEKGETMEQTNEMMMEFDSRSCNESFARVAVAAFMTQLNPTLEEVADVKTAVSEAITNAIIHAYENQVHKIRLECRLAGKTIEITVTDFGKGIPDIPKAMEPLFTTKPEMDRSGMGFAFMEAFMDSVEVESELGKGTRVRMKKAVGKGRDIWTTQSL